MKTVDQYTSEELLTITEAQTSVLIDIQCAVDGVPILPACPDKPKALSVSFDAKVFDVSIGYMNLMSFNTIEDAQNVAAAINDAQLVDVNYDYIDGAQVHYITGLINDAAGVTSKNCLSSTARKANKSAVEQYKEDFNVYEELNTAYEEAKEARAVSVSLVLDAIAEAHLAKSRKADALVKYEHYLSLADNDSKIALKFFNTNYSSLLSLLPAELLPQINGEQEC